MHTLISTTICNIITFVLLYFVWKPIRKIVLNKRNITTTPKDNMIAYGVFIVVFSAAMLIPPYATSAGLMGWATLPIAWVVGIILSFVVSVNVPAGLGTHNTQQEPTNAIMHQRNNEDAEPLVGPERKIVNK